MGESGRVTQGQGARQVMSPQRACASQMSPGLNWGQIVAILSGFAREAETLVFKIHKSLFLSVGN